GALMKLMDHTEAIGEVVNIGSTEEVTITELAARVKCLTGSSSEIVYVPYSEAYEAGFEDMSRRVPDITKVGRLIGFRPSRCLNQILEAIIAHEQQNLVSSALPQAASIRKHRAVAGV